MQVGKKESGKNEVVILSIFFLGLLTTGLLIYTDYGVHLDEFRNQHFGEKWAEYVSYTAQSMQISSIADTSKHDIVHGPAFEIFLLELQELLNISDSRNVILLRHLCNFLLFYFSTFVFYLLCKASFGSWKISLVGCVLLVIHPRIFSHAFYNTVDIAFLSFYIISTYTLVRFLRDKSFSNAVIHAATSAILIDIRIAGLILPLFTCLFYLIDVYMAENRRRMLPAIGVHLLFLAIFIVLFWPYLWSAPYSNFWTAFTSSSSFGRRAVSPWHYNFTWIVGTTPIIYTVFFLLGFFSLLKPGNESLAEYFSRGKIHLLIIALFLLPIVLPIVFGTSLFNGWRHHYFVYPMFVYIALAGIAYVHTLMSEISNRRFASFSVAAILAASLTSTLNFMFKYHPHQAAYTNSFGSEAEDYWGLSSRRILEYILNNNPGAVSIYAKSNAPVRHNLSILPLQDRQRVTVVKSPERADYLMTNNRHITPPPDYEEYYVVRIGSQVIAGAYRKSDKP